METTEQIQESCTCAVRYKHRETKRQISRQKVVILSNFKEIELRSYGEDWHPYPAIADSCQNFKDDLCFSVLLLISPLQQSVYSKFYLHMY
jgi:hypothetical protein